MLPLFSCLPPLSLPFCYSPCLPCLDQLQHPVLHASGRLPADCQGCSAAVGLAAVLATAQAQHLPQPEQLQLADMGLAGSWLAPAAFVSLRPSAAWWLLLLVGCLISRAWPCKHIPFTVKKEDRLPS
jgi:hypothetical protein